ncbi:hypothetical protein J6590_078581, partial [Homalodisca vitripennis]
MGSLKKHEELPSSESGSAVAVMVFGGWKPPMEESVGQLDLGSACPVLAAANVALGSIFVLHRIEGKSTADARGLSAHETRMRWLIGWHGGKSWRCGREATIILEEDPKGSPSVLQDARVKFVTASDSRRCTKRKENQMCVARCASNAHHEEACTRRHDIVLTCNSLFSQYLNKDDRDVYKSYLLVDGRVLGPIT